MKQAKDFVKQKQQPAAPEPRVSKLFRLRPETAKWIRLFAWNVGITETDVIESLIKERKEQEEQLNP